MTQEKHKHKEMFSDIENKQKRTKFKLILIAASAMCILGGTLLIIGLFLPPIGEIHPSVLTASGEALTFSGSCFGISGNYQLKHERMAQDYRRRMHEHNLDDDFNEEQNISYDEQ